MQKIKIGQQDGNQSMNWYYLFPIRIQILLYSLIFNQNQVPFVSELLMPKMLQDK